MSVKIFTGTEDIDAKAYLMFQYAIGLPHSFALQTINLLIKDWKKLSSTTQETLKSRLKEMVEKDDFFRVEFDLSLTFSEERFIDNGPLGDRKAAGAWKGFYDVICAYQDPPDT